MSGLKMLIIFCLFFILPVFCQYTVIIDNSTVIREVSEEYLSVALDTSLVYKRWERDMYTFDFQSVRLKTMSKALAPAYLRLGGTMSSFLIYDPNSEQYVPDNDDQIYHQNNEKGQRQMNRYDRVRDTYENFTMTVSDWRNINEFAMDVGWKFLFDFNVLLRTNGKWNSSNAKEMLDESIKRNYTANQLFELGNEPNSMPHSINFTLPASNLSVDFSILRDVLNSDQYKAYYGSTWIVGPDVTDNKFSAPPYVAEFLAGPAGNGTIINAVTCHQYYISGQTATLEDFMNPVVMDLLTTQMKRITDVVYNIMPNDTLVWLGETSSAFGGGAPFLSDTYVAGFLWMDKLGNAATLGIDVVMRQTLYGGRYSLVTNELNPLPDYWLSLLYKRLVGRKVLAVTSETPVGRLRLYAHCTKSQGIYPEGAITMFGLNVFERDIHVTIGGGLQTQSVATYFLTAHNKVDGLQSKFVDLNGRQLEMIDNSTLPPVEEMAVLLPTAEEMTFPAQSLGFFVIPNAQAPACMN